MMCLFSGVFFGQSAAQCAGTLFAILLMYYTFINRCFLFGVGVGVGGGDGVCVCVCVQNRYEKKYEKKQIANPSTRVITTKQVNKSG